MIFVIIPVHGWSKQLFTCLQSLDNQKNIDLHIVVVNSSDYFSSDCFSSEHQLDIITVPSSFFWSEAVNTGLSFINHIANYFDHILLLNNDVILSAQLISSLVSFSNENYQNSIVSPLSLDKSDCSTICKTGTIIDSWFLNQTKHPFVNQLFVPQSFSQAHSLEVDILTARCLLVPIKIFRSVGFMNTSLYPQYCADDDFSVRVKRKGFSVTLLPNLYCLLEADNDKLTPTGFFKKKSLFWLFFNRKSPFSLKSKICFGFNTPPLLARFTFSVIAIAKSIYLVVLHKIK